jgi:hypothetical protein
MKGRKEREEKQYKYSCKCHIRMPELFLTIIRLKGEADHFFNSPMT